MARLFKHTLIFYAGRLIDRSTQKLTYDDTFSLLNGNSHLLRQKLFVKENKFLTLELSNRSVYKPEYSATVQELVALAVPLQGHVLSLLADYHHLYYDWLVNSGKATGASILRVMRLTSSQHVKRIAPIAEGVDTIGEILSEFGVKSEDDFMYRAIGLASKKQMDAVFKKEQAIYDTVAFLKDLKANKDLTDANGEKLQNNVWILKMLTALGKYTTLSPRQIEQSRKVIRLFQYHSSKGTAIPQWRFASAERNLRKKIIRLAHAQPHLRSHLLPLVTKSASYQELRENASYEEMEIWVENAIKLYHQGRIELGDVLFPLTSWYQDVHQAIDHISGGKRSGGVGMSARKLLKWYDEN